MHVIDRKISEWFFLQDGPAYYLDVNCDRGIVGFSLSIQLTEAEIELYRQRGLDYISELANEIFQRSDPGEPRRVQNPELEKRIYDAIMAWNADH